MIKAKATIRHIRVSPKKMSLLAVAIRGKNLDQARWIIGNSRKGCAPYFLHALSNAEAILIEKGQTTSEAKICSSAVDQGPRLKRQRAGSRGYSYSYKHNMSHLTLELCSKAPTSQQNAGSQESRPESVGKNKKIIRKLDKKPIKPSETKKKANKKG